jgi:hypothetical protein
MYRLKKKGMGHTDFMIYMFFPLHKANIYAAAEIDDMKIEDFEWNNGKNGDDLLHISSHSSGIYSKHKYEYPLTVSF